MSLRSKLKGNYWVERIYFFLKYELTSFVLGDKFIIRRQFLNKLGYEPNIENPRTMAEKLQWVKLYNRQPFNTIAADKLRVREFYRENFGEEYIIPLLCTFNSWKDLSLDKLPDEPFIIKANTGTSTWQIVRDKKTLDLEQLKKNCRRWLNMNHYYASQEWQYKNIKPCLIVEKLMTDKNGKIPTDYKFHYINGELQFIYCVADREGDSYRAMFSPDWKLLPFQWVSTTNHTPLRTSVNEPKPANLEKMIEFGNVIAKKFPYYVRVDYYEVDGHLYFGEITMHHGSGMNKFYPPEAEVPYAKKMELNLSDKQN